MDPDLGVVAAEFGRAIVQAMVADAWTTLRPRLARIFTQSDAEHLVDPLRADQAALDAGRLSADAVAGKWAGRLEHLLHTHPRLQAELAAVLTEPRSDSRSRATVEQSVSGTGNQVTAAGRDVVTSQSRTTNHRTTHFGGILIVIAVAVALLLGGGMLVVNVIAPAFSDGSEAIDTDTSCGDFLQFSASARDQAVKRMAVEMGVSGAGHPWLLNNVDYSCGQSPGTPVGDVVARQNY